MTDLVVYLINFYKKYLQNVKYNVKRACIFHLIFVSVLSNVILSGKNRGAGGEEGVGVGGWLYLTDKIR